MDTHPYHAPLCFVKPTPDMQIKVNAESLLGDFCFWQKYIFLRWASMWIIVGRSTCPTFTNGQGLVCVWPFNLLLFHFLISASIQIQSCACSLSRPNSELLGLIQICIVTFRLIFQRILKCEMILSEQPPVYSKPKDSQAQAAATSYPAQGASYYPQGQVQKGTLHSLCEQIQCCWGNFDGTTFRFRCNTREQASPLSTLAPLLPTPTSTHRHYCKSRKPSYHLFVPSRAHPLFPMPTLFLTSKQKVITNDLLQQELFTLSRAPNFFRQPKATVWQQSLWITNIEEE